MKKCILFNFNWKKDWGFHSEFKLFGYWEVYIIQKKWFFFDLFPVIHYLYWQEKRNAEKSFKHSMIDTILRCVEYKLHMFYFRRIYIYFQTNYSVLGKSNGWWSCSEIFAGKDVTISKHCISWDIREVFTVDASMIFQVCLRSGWPTTDWA